MRTVVALIFLVLGLLFECKASNNFNSDTIYQVSMISQGDTVFLTNKQDPLMSVYGQLTLNRKGKVLLNYYENDMEIRGSQDAIFDEYYTPNIGHLYFFRYDDRPLYDRVLVICSKKDTAFVVGITENNSNTIFGDVDLDGFFEIGGQKQQNNRESVVFEIRDRINIDTTLTQILNKLIKSK